MIVLVTDSTAYLTRQEAKTLGVVTVPMNYSHDGKIMHSEGYAGEQCDMMAVQVGTEAHYTTSQASFASFFSVMEDIIREGNQVLCLAISSRFSGTYANARKAAQELGDENAVAVDTKTTAGAMYLLIKRAAQWIADGLSLREVADNVRREREMTHTYFSVDDMTPLRKSGRLGFVRLSVSTILNIRPVLRIISGGITTFTTARGRHEQVRILKSTVKNAHGPVVVQHWHADDAAAQLAQSLREENHLVEIRTVGPVLAIHLGNGCVSVAWMEA